MNSKAKQYDIIKLMPCEKGCIAVGYGHKLIK